MKVSIISDYHLEFCVSTDLPGGDLLLMAGDMFGAGYIAEHRNDADARKAKGRAAKFCQTQLSKYKKVLYVMGNHEHYRFTFQDTAPLLRRFLAEHAPNVMLLDNQTTTIKGITFLGTTLWSTCGIHRPGVTALRIQNGLRDFQVIKMREMSSISMERTFTPWDAAAEHVQALGFLQRRMPRKKPAVILAHHAPSFMSAHGDEYGSQYLDDAYCSNLHWLFDKYPNIRLAVHGHTHHREDYRLGAHNARVVANARGYFPHEARSRHFNPSAADFDLEELFE